MTDSGTAPWLTVMESIDGTKYAPGDGKSPTIESWLDAIAAAYPGMKPYCDAEKSQDYFSWCGLTVGFCMAKSGIPPVFGATDTGRFLWAAAWMGWGTAVPNPQPGDVVIFDFGNNDHHVSLFVKDNGNGTWACHGGNQGHQVTVSNFHKSNVMGVRRPTVGAVVTVASPSVVPASVAIATSPSVQSFNACVLLVLHDEGGNDDDPDDPGGRTSRGITQSDWNDWLKTHPSLPADVFAAPQDQIIAIYHDKYWGKLSCDSLPAGVDYVVFDYGVLSGNGQSARVLQGYAGAAVDGDIGPQTIAAAAKADVPTLINQISDERIAYMQQSPVWWKYGAGWTARVQRGRAAALAMASAAANPQKQIAPAPSSPQTQVQLPAGGKQMTPDQIAQIIVTIVTALQAQQNSGGAQSPALNPATIQALVTALTQQVSQASPPAPSPAAASGTGPSPATPLIAVTPPSAVSNPSVQIGALGLAISSVLQALGTIAPPFSTALGSGVASAASSATIPSPLLGTLATVIPLIITGVGATTGWGSLLGIASSLIGAIGNAAKKTQ